jgi:hypothetical protein
MSNQSCATKAGLAVKDMIKKVRQMMLKTQNGMRPILKIQMTIIFTKSTFLTFTIIRD